MADSQASKNEVRTKARQPRSDVPGFTPETLNVHPEISASDVPEAAWSLGGDLSVKAHRGRDGLWIVVRREGRGGVALRTFPIMGAFEVQSAETGPKEARWKISTRAGDYDIRVRIIGARTLRMTSRLTPSQNLLVAFWPRDLYPLDAGDDPTKAQGRVEAAQRGLNGGFCYFCVSEPEFGSVLYMQNLSALNDFYRLTRTKPDGVVGGQWPELGYEPPAAPMGNSPPVDPLPQGHEVTVSDVLLAFRDDARPSEFTSARNFVDMLADIYWCLEGFEPEVRDWPGRAEKTLHDLKASPHATVSQYGCTYLHPYVASEYPDSMVQMSVLATLREYEDARGARDDFSLRLEAGMHKFFDEKLGATRRYLPDVGGDKDKDAVDSWYLYHPLMNLGRLAIRGEAWAKTQFFNSLDYVVRAARHFAYKWPVIYKMDDFSVVENTRGPEGLGQTDVGGIFAYVMLQAHELSGDTTYIEEAKKALKTLEGRRFELVYQTNLTAWGATACLKMWRLTRDDHYLDQSVTFVAGFLHNCELWSSRIGFADRYPNFFGVTCLHDGPYMAAYEAFEAFMAFDECLRIGGRDIPASVRLLLAEYWRHALDVLWSFYPDALPEDALAKDIRNGHIDRNLSFPLEDLYGDGSPAGQVGQEIYGAGSAFVVASRAFVRIPVTSFVVFANYPAEVRHNGGKARIDLLGPPGRRARLQLRGKDLTGVELVTDNGEVLPPVPFENGVEYDLPADGRFELSWQIPISSGRP